VREADQGEYVVGGAAGRRVQPQRVLPLVAIGFAAVELGDRGAGEVGDGGQVDDQLVGAAEGVAVEFGAEFVDGAGVQRPVDSDPAGGRVRLRENQRQFRQLVGREGGVTELVVGQQPGRA